MAELMELLLLFGCSGARLMLLLTHHQLTKGAEAAAADGARSSGHDVTLETILVILVADISVVEWHYNYALKVVILLVAILKCIVAFLGRRWQGSSGLAG